MDALVAVTRTSAVRCMSDLIEMNNPEIKDISLSEFKELIRIWKSDNIKQIVQSQNHSREFAEESVEKYYDSSFPDGINSKGQILKAIRCSASQQTAGYLWVTEPKEEKGCYILSYLHILPKNRRKGLATAVINWIEKQARSSGVSRIRLSVFSGSEGAKGLYSKLGFSEVFAGMKKEF